MPNKEYLWDEFPDIAWNGDHFGAAWTENSVRDGTAPWQIHFASYRRTATASTLIADRLLDVEATKSGWNRTTQIHAIGGAWLAQHTRWQANTDPLAVFDWINDQGNILASFTPFTVNADALSSSSFVKTRPRVQDWDAERRIGVPVIFRIVVRAPRSRQATGTTSANPCGQSLVAQWRVS